MIQRRDELDWHELDTVAAALAANGDFARATQFQTLALEKRAADEDLSKDRRAAARKDERASGQVSQRPRLRAGLPRHRRDESRQAVMQIDTDTPILAGAHRRPASVLPARGAWLAALGGAALLFPFAFPAFFVARATDMVSPWLSCRWPRVWARCSAPGSR